MRWHYLRCDLHLDKSIYLMVMNMRTSRNIWQQLDAMYGTSESIDRTRVSQRRSHCEMSKKQ